MSPIDEPDDNAPAEGAKPSAGGSGKVGYKNPPVEHQFKPGQSGNPRGRKKAAETVGEIFDEEMAKRVAVTDERGRRSWISLERATIRALVRRATRNDSALRLAIDLRERFRGSDARHVDRRVLSPQDAALLDEIIEERAREIALDHAMPKPDEPS